MKHELHARARGILIGLGLTLLVGLFGGCTATSTLKAIEASNRVDDVRAHVETEQHRSLLIDEYRVTLYRLNAAKTDEERAAILNEAWNDRDLFEFWYAQAQLARATHIATVDAKLESSRSVLDLLAKDVGRKLRRPLESLDDWVAEQAARMAAERGGGADYGSSAHGAPSTQPGN